MNHVLLVSTYTDTEYAAILYIMYAQYIGYLAHCAHSNNNYAVT